MIPDEVKKPRIYRTSKKPALSAEKNRYYNFHDPIKTEEIDDLKVEEEDPVLLMVYRIQRMVSLMNCQLIRKVKF